MVVYIFYHPVDSPLDITETMLQWAKKNCNSYITNDYDTAKQSYRFYFSQQKDYINFILKWQR